MLAGNALTGSNRFRFGADSFVHRFGASLNHHLHFHCFVIEGVFERVADREARFRQAEALAPDSIDAIADKAQRRVLQWFARSGLPEPDDACDMLEWNNGGFFVDASVRTTGRDSTGLERLALLRTPAVRARTYPANR